MNAKAPFHPKILIYGPPGTGKTALALTAGSVSQIIDCDGGLRTALRFKDPFTPERVQTDVVQCLEDNPASPSGFAKLRAATLDVAKACSAKTYPFKILVIDSLSTAADFAMRYVMNNCGKLGSPPEIQHWGQAIGEIKNVLLTLRSLPLCVVLLAHSQRDMVNGVPVEEVGVYGKNLPALIPGYFDEVWYSKVQEVGAGQKKFVLVTKGSEFRVARSRDNLPDLQEQNQGLRGLLDKMGYKI